MNIIFKITITETPDFHITTNYNKTILGEYRQDAGYKTQNIKKSAKTNENVYFRQGRNGDKMGRDCCLSPKAL